MLAQQSHVYSSEQHKIAVKSELPACTRENGSLSRLWERTTVIVLTNYSPTVVAWNSSSLFDS